MKKNLFLVMAAITLVIATATGSYALTATKTVDATAIVQAVCQFGAAAVTLDFGTLDEYTNTAAILTADDGGLTLGCSNGYNASVSHAGLNDSGGQKYLINGANTIAYSLWTGAADLANPVTVVGSGLGNDILDFTARIPANAADEKPAGTYSDTITFTITY